MKNKFFILIFGVLAIIIVAMNLPASKTKLLLISVATTTQQVVNLQVGVATSTTQGPKLGWGQSLEYTLVPKDGLLYSADGSKIIREMVAQTSTTKATIVDVGKKILDFDVSPDGSLLAYSMRLANPGPDPNQAGVSKAGNGDTLILRNLNSADELTLYSDPQDENFEIKSIKFSPDGKTLFFSTNFLGVVDLQTKKLEKVNDHGTGGNCPTQSIQDISNDGSEALLFTGCSEGGYQQILNVNNGTAVQVPGYVGEGPGGPNIVQAFINDDTLIGSYQGTSTTEAMLYNAQAQPIKMISGPMQASVPVIDNISDPAQVFFGVYTDVPVERAIDFYSIDRNTLEVSKVQEKRGLIVNDGNRWLTNNYLENPILIGS